MNNVRMHTAPFSTMRSRFAPARRPALWGLLRVAGAPVPPGFNRMREDEPAQRVADTTAQIVAVKVRSPIFSDNRRPSRAPRIMLSVVEVTGRHRRHRELALVDPLMAAVARDYLIPAADYGRLGVPGCGAACCSRSLFLRGSREFSVSKTFFVHQRTKKIRTIGVNGEIITKTHSIFS
jgi:hypothetical protein